MSAAGVTTTSLTTCSTVTDVVAYALSASARTMAVPLPFEVISPDPSTVATEVSPDDHSNCASTTGWPFPSQASARTRTVSASHANSMAPGLTTMSRTTWSTVTDAEPATFSASAVMATVPVPIAVTNPVSSTVATDSSALDHVKLRTCSTAWPLASSASAARRTVSISETIVSTAGVTTTSCTTWSTVSDAEPETPSASAPIAAVPLFTDVVSPDASTVATEESLDDHAKLSTRSTA